MTSTLQQRVDKDSIINVTFIPFQNRKGVRDILDVTDAVFVSFQDLPVLTTGSPNKYFDGLAAGKFVITNFGGWIKGEIDHHRFGFVIDRSRNDFVEKITQVLDSKHKLELASVAARSLAEEKYSRRKLSKQFAGLFLSHRHN
jgi:glycosyltransferase involved in cell wall biosynthesis